MMNTLYCVAFVMISGNDVKFALLLGAKDEPNMFEIMTNIDKAVIANEFVITLPNGVQIHATPNSLRVDAVTEKGDQF